MIGAYTWALWMEREGRGRIMAFRLIGILLVLQLIVRLTIGGGPDWIADLGGFAAGFAASFALAPDGGARLRRLRDRARGM
jgi:membrane associated rhomboid family serine protease